MTLIELLMVIAIAGILAGLAAPSMMRFVQKSAMQSLSNDFISDIQRTRVEAVNRNSCATICKSANTEAAAPRCATAGDDWHLGWIVYLNPSCDRTVTVADPAVAGDIIFIRQPGDPRYTLVTGDGTDALTFGPKGTLPLASTGTFTLQDSQDNSSPLARSICIDVMGRARIVAEAGC